MEVVIRDSEGIVAGTQSPVPVFLFSAASTVKFHQTVAAEFLHSPARTQSGTQWVIDLQYVGIGREPVEHCLPLECEDRQQMVPMQDLAAPEDQFVVLQQVIAVFIDIYLEAAVGRMDRKCVMV